MIIDLQSFVRKGGPEKTRRLPRNKQKKTERRNRP